MSKKSEEEKIECEPVTMEEFTATMRGLLSVKVETRIENRTPTREELNQKFKLERRG